MRWTGPARNFRTTRIVGTHVQQAKTTITQIPDPFYVDVSKPAVPKSAVEVQALRIRLSDLKAQLQDAASRRRTVADQLPEASIESRPGLTARLNELDSRILRIEKDISQSQLALNSADASIFVQGTGMPLPNDVVSRVTSEIIPIVAILSVFVLGPFSVAISRWIWKRSTTPQPLRSGGLDAAAQHRLEQLQQSMDTIAIEIERISEGQRFVTKLLGDRSLSAGASEALRTPQNQPSTAREGR
jgi:hypothetical protein